MRLRKTWVILLATVLLSGCGGRTETPDPAAAEPPRPTVLLVGEGNGNHAVPLGLFGGGKSYQAPEFADAEFHPDKAEGNDKVKIDLSAVSEGYLAVAGRSERRLKFQVMTDEITYTYDMASDGTPSIFPLQSGSGAYRARVMENVVDSKYAELYSVEFQAHLSNEFLPFLRPSDYTPYTADSACVKKAAELASGARTALDVVTAVYDYVCDSVKYDTHKAETVRSGYLPDPDETLATGKGICFDYAALAAAMLRSQGIPTKMIFGYVSPDDLYHAWNMFYTEETGWVTVSYKVSGESWNRLDLTFVANGADDKFVGDGSNYTDLYFY